MADRRVDHLLIGGGIAAATCAGALREGGGDGSVLLVSRELDPPYHRPPLTKGYLAGAETKSSLALELPGDVEVLSRTSVVALDPAARTVTLSSKQTIEYGTALLATGAMVRRLQIDGAGLEGVHYLRVPGNADSLKTDVDYARNVVCVGGSFIGCEVAATVTAAYGKRCTIVMLEDQPMERALGLQGGAWVRSVLEGHGIEVIGGAEVERFEPASANSGRVRRVVLAGGRTLDADVVVAGVGVNPDVMVARKAGLEIGERGGVRCDAQLAVLGAEGLYAAGDICEFDSTLHDQVVRIEHEEVAAAHGRTVAANMLGAGAPHTEVPFFWSDLSDWAGMELLGAPPRWDDEVVDGDVDGGQFAIWYLKDGRVVGLLSASGYADLDRGTELVASDEVVEVESLRN
jgi:3-phenylpropionate/trans-cinnamate dioxygenase ferredoxin reductase component